MNMLFDQIIRHKQSAYRNIWSWVILSYSCMIFFSNIPFDNIFASYLLLFIMISTTRSSFELQNDKCDTFPKWRPCVNTERGPEGGSWERQKTKWMTEVQKSHREKKKINILSLGQFVRTKNFFPLSIWLSLSHLSFSALSLKKSINLLNFLSI